jgi:hypothetical protein
MYKDTSEIINLVTAFEERTLLKSEWTHATHLTVGLYYCVRYPFGKAINVMRDGIYWLNDAHGIANTNIGGYHETLTIFWLITIRQFIETSKSFKLVDLANGLLEACNDPKLPFRYYSRELLASSEAREQHVQPDLDIFYLFRNTARFSVQTNDVATCSYL